MNPRAWIVHGLVSGALVAAPAPLAQLSDDVRARPGDPVAAARLGSALAHGEWLMPAAAPPDVRWLPGAIRGTPAMGPVPSPDGRREVRCEGTILRLVSLPDGAPLSEGSLASVPLAVAWHPSGAVLAVATGAGCELRDGRTLGLKKVRLPGASGPAMAFSPDGLWLATGMAEGGVALWDWGMGQARATGGPGLGRVESVAFDATGTWLRGRTASGEAVLDARPGSAWDAGWHGLPFLAGAAFDGTGHHVVTVDEVGRVERVPWQEPGPGVRVLLASTPSSLAWDASGTWVATVMGASKARAWKFQTGLPVGAWASHPGAWTAGTDPTGSWLWSASRESVRVVRPASGELAWAGTNGPVHACVIDPGGRWVAAAMGPAGRVMATLWKADEPGREASRFALEAPLPFDLEPSGPWIVSGGPGGGLRQRLALTPDAPVDRPVIGAGRRLDEARYASGGRRVLAREGGVVTVWDAVSGRQVGQAVDAGALGWPGLDVSPDGRWLRVEKADGGVEAWALQTGERVASWEPPGRRVRSVVLPGSRFAPDGARMLVPEGMGGVRLVPLPPLAAAPAWLEGWARLTWGRPDGWSAAERLALEDQVRRADPRDPWTAWGRWWMADRGTRTTSPLGTARPLAWAMHWAGRNDPVAALEAWRWAPAEAGVRAALVRQMQTNQSWGRLNRIEQGAWLAR